MASYRYWKLNSPPGWYAFTALQFYSDGRCVTKLNGTFTTDNASWGMVDMGSSVSADSVSFVGGGYGVPNTSSFSVVGSNDGANFTPVFTGTLQYCGFNIIAATSIGAPNSGWTCWSCGNLQSALPPLSATVTMDNANPDMYGVPSSYNGFTRYGIQVPVITGGYLVNPVAVYDFIPTTYQWQMYNGSVWSDMVGKTTKEFPTDVYQWAIPAHVGDQFRLKITQGTVVGYGAVVSVNPFAVGGSISGASSVIVNTPITLSSDPYGGNLVSYTYNWAGTDGVSGTAKTMTKTFTTTGTKTITCVVTSGGLSSTFTKTITVVQPPISATIAVTPTTGDINQNFAFSISGVSGGVSPGSYTYLWSGPDGLTGTGTSVSKVFSSVGTKTVTCTITSGGSSNVFTVTATVTAPAIVGTITATPNTLNIGETTTFSVTGVSGGTGSYTYAWSGTDSLSGTAASITKSYTTVGTKTGTCTITSGTQTLVLNTSVTVAVPAIVGTITATPTTGNIGDSITYAVTGVSGGTGTYTYSWSGTDTLSGTSASVSKSYTTTGTKTATCTITSGSQTLVLNTSSTIGVLTTTGNIVVTPSTSVMLGNPVTFTMNAAGGTGSFTYSWSGSESISGTTNEVTKTFSSIGVKNVTCAVTSGGVTTNFTATVTITAVPALVVSIASNLVKQLPNGNIVFTSTVSGGTGIYTYSWSTTDGLTSTIANPTFAWSSLGSKTVTLTVSSGTQNVSATVNVSIVSTLTPNLGRLCFIG